MNLGGGGQKMECIDQTVPPQNVYTEALTTNLTVFGDRVYTEASR